MALTPGTLTVMLDTAWRVTLVLAVAWGATRLLGRRPAAVRHAVWAAALLVALAVPMLAGVVPSWQTCRPAGGARRGPRRRALVTERSAVASHSAAALHR